IYINIVCNYTIFILLHLLILLNLLLLMIMRSHNSTLFPYTTLFRSSFNSRSNSYSLSGSSTICASRSSENRAASCFFNVSYAVRSEEHTSELQSRENLVCRLLLEKKKK